MWIATGVWAVCSSRLAVTTVALSNTSLTTEQRSGPSHFGTCSSGVAVFSSRLGPAGVSGRNWSVGANYSAGRAL